MKIDSLQNKLEELNRYYQLFNSNVNTRNSEQINRIYKSVKCLANGISLNIVPVYYRKDNELINYRNGAYCLTLSQTGGDTGYLYVEPKKVDPQDSTRMIYCNPYDSGCSYNLSLQPPTRSNAAPIEDAENILEIDIDNDNILSTRYPENTETSPRRRFNRPIFILRNKIKRFTTYFNF